MYVRTIPFSLISLLLLLSFTEATIEELQTQLVEAVKLVERIKQSEKYESNDFNCSNFDGNSGLLHLLSDEKRFVRNKVMTKRLFLQQFLFRDCSQIYEHGYQVSGIYPVWLQQVYRFTLFYCDMDTISEITSKRGWTVIQRRINGEVNFERKWNDYVKGFGDLEGEYWVGLGNIHALTWQVPYIDRIWTDYVPPRLRIDMEDWDGIRAFVENDKFLVTRAEWNYAISDIGDFNGTAHPPPSIGSLNSQVFSTVDNDNTRANCPKVFRGGWWFHPTCALANLNGPYTKRKTFMGPNTIYWSDWYYANKNDTALRTVSMKLQF